MTGRRFALVILQGVSALDMVLKEGARWMKVRLVGKTEPRPAAVCLDALLLHKHLDHLAHSVGGLNLQCGLGAPRRGAEVGANLDPHPSIYHKLKLFRICTLHTFAIGIDSRSAVPVAAPYHTASASHPMETADLKCA